MDLFDLRNHLMNHYQKLNSVTSVIKNGREPILGSRSSRKSSSRARNVRRHDCLTPLEKLSTYRSELSTSQVYFYLHFLNKIDKKNRFWNDLVYF